MANAKRVTTFAPEQDISLVARKQLSGGQKAGIAYSVRLGVEASLGDRQALENNLVANSKIYETISDGPKDWPWVNASDIRLPYAATQMDAFVAYIAAMALGPRFYRVSGKTPEAANWAPRVERFYNAELLRHRGTAQTWHDAHVQQVMLGARDGLGIIQPVWRKTTEARKVAIFSHELDENQAPIIGDDARPKFKKQIQEVEVDVYDDVELKVHELRNIILSPAALTTASFNSAASITVVEYPFEDELMEMVRAGILWEDEVELALQYVPTGSSELAVSRQPVETYTTAEQVSTAAGQGVQVSEFFRKRGPIEMYICYSNQFDLDNDRQVENNIFFVHAQSWRLLGWMHYPYFSQQRNFFGFAPLPLPNRLIGLSLIGRLGAIDAELDSIWNGRNNIISIGLKPPLKIRRGANIDDDELSWGLDRRWEMDDISPDGDVGFMAPPPVNPISIEQEQSLMGYGDRFTGLSNPAQGTPTSSRRTATEIRNMMAATSSRMNLIVMRYRTNARAIINFIHDLKKQYATKDPTFTNGLNQLTIPLDVLNLDYQIDIWGADDPTDVATRRTEIMALYDLLMKNPIIQQDPGKVWEALMMVIQVFERPDIERLIGTKEEFMAQQQQAQQHQMMAQAMGAHPPPQGNPHQPSQPPNGKAMQPAGAV